jgi:GT2 family glycosyltransferase
MRKASIIVLCHNRWADTKRCLLSLKRFTDPGRYELLVYDNASTDATLAGLRRLARGWPQLRIIVNEENRTFARAVNAGMREARGDYFVWLNNDTVLCRGWLESLVAAAESGEDVAAAGPMTEHIAPPLQKCRPFRSSARPRLEETPFLGGFCFLLKRAAAERAGSLDERFFWGWEDMDYCLRLRQAGYRLMLARHVFVRHDGSKTIATMAPPTRTRTDTRNRGLIRSKWERSEPWGAELPTLIRRSPTPWTSVSLVVVARGSSRRVKRCLDSVRACAGEIPAEILAASLDSAAGGAELKALARARPDIRVLGAWKGITYSHAVNLALREARGDYFVVLADDALAAPGWIEGLVKAARSNPAAGVVVPRGGEDSCLLIPRIAFASIGDFDDRFKSGLGFEDYCFRTRQRGFHVVAAGGVRLRRADRRRTESADDRGLAFDKWAGHPLYPMPTRR